MKAIFTIEFEIDGERPSKEVLHSGVWKMLSEATYIGSEQVDGTDDWGIEIREITFNVEE